MLAAFNILFAVVGDHLNSVILAASSKTSTPLSPHLSARISVPLPGPPPIYLLALSHLRSASYAALTCGKRSEIGVFSSIISEARLEWKNPGKLNKIASKAALHPTGI